MSGGRDPFADALTPFSDEEKAFADEEAKKEAAIRKARRQAFLARLLSDPEGREWIWEILTRCSTFAIIHASGPNGFPDPLATEFHRGIWDAGWKLWCELDDAVPEMASRMRREHQSKD
jgi:hypothetical protein